MSANTLTLDDLHRLHCGQRLNDDFYERFGFSVKITRPNCAATADFDWHRVARAVLPTLARKQYLEDCARLFADAYNS